MNIVFRFVFCLELALILVVIIINIKSFKRDYVEKIQVRYYKYYWLMLDQTSNFQSTLI
jgi:hypothetical protein